MSMDADIFKGYLGKQITVYLKDGSTISGIADGYTRDDDDGDCLTVQTKHGLLYGADAPDIDHIDIVE